MGGNYRKTMVAVLAAVLVLGFAIPAISQSPGAANSFDITLSVTPNAEYRDGIVYYSVVAENENVIGANDAIVDVTFTLPAPDGTFTGTQVVLADDMEFKVGDTVTWSSLTHPELAFSLSSINAGVSPVRAKAEYDAQYLADEPYAASGSKDIPVTVRQWASLGDFVWNDLDKDGIQDEAEPGIGNVVVDLWSADLNGNPIAKIGTTTTNSSGYYLFDQLKAGHYLVDFVPPEGDWYFSPQNVGADDSKDSDANRTTGISDRVTLTFGQANLTVDAGMYELFEQLEVSKTVETSYVRTHEWDIDKRVTTRNEGTLADGTPKIWLYVDGSGDERAEWTVDVAYGGSDDSEHNVSGTITIENTGDLDAVIESVEDILGGVAIDPADLNFGVTFPHTLAVGAPPLVGTYDVDVDSKVQGTNVVNVITERDTYTADADIVWGEPDEEFFATVNIRDLSDLFGEVDLGTVTAPNGDTFTYDELFAWADPRFKDAAGGTHREFTFNNTARIVETGQSASAVLKINWYTQSIGDFVWNDVNMDGIQDAGELGIPNVTVNLWTVDGDKNPLAPIYKTTTTDSTGYYLFADVMHGEYRVEFVLPDGTWYFSPQNVGADDKDSDANPLNGVSDLIDLQKGEIDLTIDAGMYQDRPVCWGDETAWAFGGSFANPNWNFVDNRFWGWTNGPLSPGSYQWPIYAGAGQNILSNGTIVGTLYVNYTGGNVTVKYELDEGYYLGETHLWVGKEPLPGVKRGRSTVYTNAPGQFPWGTNYGFDPLDSNTWKSTWEWTKSGFTGDIYVAAHSVVWMEVECTDMH